MTDRRRAHPPAPQLLALSTALNVDASAHFDTALPLGNGKVIVYTATAIPQAEIVQ